MCEQCLQDAVSYTPTPRIKYSGGGHRSGRRYPFLSGVADSIAADSVSKGGVVTVLLSDRDHDELASELAKRAIVLREREDV